ncbi:MAG: dihydrolipoyl dehydrogenase [Rhodospirillaceae bacterium]|jgi:dihydrolipoamide dehydrogenase|nr:dihydrolipoyl dehydrogenase [Rhodospirillaceae bacterium]
MAEKSYDIIIVGGGPGGYVTAIRAAQLGMKTAVVEREHLGGICLNWGCIPTKALLRSAEVYRNAQHADEYGLKISGIEFDLKKIVERSRGISKQLSSGVGYLLKKNKVDVIDGHGKLAGSGNLTVEKDGKKVADLTAKHIILATGARARSLPGLEPDGKLVWTYKEAMVPDALPKSLLVVGSGAIGIEFASFYHTLGVDVTVVEVLPRVLPVEDEEISELAHKAFEKDGLKIMTSATVTALDKGSDNVTTKIEQDGKTTELTVDRVIMAVGIVGNVEDIGLEGTKVKVDRTHVVINEWSETGEKGVYAIGDLAGPPWLAHKASHEGIICVEKIAGEKGVHPLNTLKIPGCTYCHPQVASVGLTEAAAKEKGYDVKIGRFPFVGNGKAIALGEPEGLVKTVFDAKTGEMLGAHMIGAEVTELIQGYAVGMTLETTEAELMETVFPHPTLSEMMHEAVLDAYGRTIHF